MDNNRHQAVLALRSVAAQAEKLASDLEGNRLWEGEFSTAMSEIQRAMRSVPSGVR